ncbi:efflux RND transporter periplasmic adaptor subunit [Belnapia sp. T6]|uniref:Efflux RND transporter periplasmic adaptor subunit n=1 Tax=Belnapia mucosa TaxID=2804532 RepID=A0ABS1VA30_9PROT|nr:efflux RND transporter periplasmic adaptor subunit [Belnapia mucosa]MBL6458518.1 efflux RND transporter periplasmic adaptor subunit [Belnapia mucosa]
MRSIVLPALLLAAGPALAQRLPAPLPAADFPCQVTSSRRIELASPVVGVLSDVLVERGDRVRRGQVVAQLQSEVEQAQVALAQARASSDAQLKLRRARMALADRTLSRNRPLAGERFVSEQELDQIRTERDVAAMDAASATESLVIARAELEQARAALAIRSIRSPVDGVVTDRILSGGEQVRDKPILVIEQVDRLHVEVSLPSALRTGLHVGSHARISFLLPGLDPVLAEVAVVDPVVDPRSDTFNIRFVLDNVAGRIPAGIKCRAALEPAS